MSRQLGLFWIFLLAFLSIEDEIERESQQNVSFFLTLLAIDFIMFFQFDMPFIFSLTDSIVKSILSSVTTQQYTRFAINMRKRRGKRRSLKFKWCILMPKKNREENNFKGKSKFLCYFFAIFGLKKKR